MDTTTTDGGSAVAEEPTTAAVTDAPVAPAADKSTSQAPSVAPSEAVSTETKAPEAPDDIESWAEKKGLPMDDPVKLAAMVRESEKKMHEATSKAREFENASVAQVPVDYTGNPQVDTLAQTVNTLLIQNNVRDFFQSNPDAREYESKMAEIVTARPNLQNDLDALYALARTDPSRESQLRNEGGREALENLAQKQGQIPPSANATNSGVYESQTITPGNVSTLIAKNDQAWFEKNHKAISQALSGK